MSRKFNSGTGGCKSRGVGGCGMSKHRGSGNVGHPNRLLREQMASMLNRRASPRLTQMYPTVHQALRGSK